jgi:hypothetical protein
VPTILFADVLFFGSTFFYRDVSLYFHPTWRLVREIVLSGHFPLWNHWYSGGQPLAANPDYGVFYPVQWLILLFDYALAFRLHLLIHVYIALAGMYLFLRSLALRVPSAVFGALAFGTGGFFLAYLSIPTILFPLAWVPLILMFVRRFLLRPNVRSFACAAAALAMQLLVGEPTTILQTGVLIASYSLYRGYRDGAGGRLRASARVLALSAMVIVAASLIAAPQILPMIDLFGDTARQGGIGSFAVVSTWSMPPVRPLELFFPAILGRSENSGALYWGMKLYGGHNAAYIASLYCGLLVGVMALTGLIARRRGRVFVAMIVFFSWLVAIGSNTPLLRLLYDAGVFSSFRYPEKFFLLAMVALIVFAAVTFDRSVRGDRHLQFLSLSVSAVVLGVALIFFGLSWTAGYASWMQSIWSIPERILPVVVAVSRWDWLRALVSASVITVLFLVLFRRGTSRAWYAAVMLFVVADLGLIAGRVAERFPPEFLDPPPIVRDLPPDPSPYRLFSELQIAYDRGRAPSWPGNGRFWLARNALFPRTPAAWGYRTVIDGDYDITNLEPTRNLYAAARRTLDLGLDELPEVFYAISNVGAVVRMKPGDPRRFLIDPEQQAPAYVSPVGPYPRYYFADQMVQFSGLEDFVEKTMRREWSRHVAFVDWGAFAPAEGRVVSVRERPNDMLLDVESSGRGFLVISVTPHRYWRATIDSRPAPLMVTNVGYQGLVIPRGSHRVELRYRNPVIVAGGVVSLLTILSLSAAVLLSRRRVRSFP